MDVANDNEPGKICWVDMTVDDAEGLRDFYAAVAGWETENVDMGGYADFAMTMPGSGIPAAGICHARGSNAELPRQWLIYISVEDAEVSAAACVENGGKVLVGPKSMGGGTFAVIEDPGGAVAAIYQAQ
jgi:predicted enzyme related to lactoylglutathione lyase